MRTSETFIPGIGDFILPGVHYGPPVRIVTVINDYRLRRNGEPLPGDRVPLKDGSPGIVVAVRKTETGYALCLAPEPMIDRNKYLESGGTCPTPLRSENPLVEPEFIRE